MSKSRNAGAENPMFGKKHTHEGLEKMRLAHLGKPCRRSNPELWKQHLSEALKGKAAGDKNPMWNGGIKHDRGYKKIHQPGHPHADKQGYVYEHRLILEKKMGRYLNPKEKPHHINEDRSDNQPKNIEFYPNNGEHMIAAHVDRNEKGQFCKKTAGRLLDGRPWDELPNAKS